MALVDLSVVEQCYRAVLAVERGEPKIVVATPAPSDSLRATGAVWGEPPAVSARAAQWCFIER